MWSPTKTSQLEFLGCQNNFLKEKTSLLFSKTNKAKNQIPALILYCLLHPTKLLHMSLKVSGVWPHSIHSIVTMGTSLPSLFQSHLLMVHIYSSPASVPFYSLEFSSHKLELSHCTKFVLTAPSHM